jgi:hypothetical protein
VNSNTSTKSKLCCSKYFLSTALNSATVLATSEFKSASYSSDNTDVREVFSRSGYQKNG